jgi:hypothetical protein
MAWTDEIDAADDRFHPRTDDPWWNESTYVSFRVPERNLMGMFYYFFRPNQNCATGGPTVWDDTGADMSTIRHWGYDMHMPIPEGAEPFEVALANGMTIRTLEPQKKYKYEYEGVGCEIDLTYEAAREPYYLKLEEGTVPGGVRDLVKEVSEKVTTGHYEQFGYINGRINLEGEEIEVADSFAMKDRSWGPRPILGHMDRPRVGYCCAAASPDHAYHVWTATDLPWDEDPVENAIDRVTSGYYVEDGVVGDLVEGTRQVIERGEDGRMVREIIEAKDHLGRELHAEAESTGAVIRWPGLYGDLMYFAHLTNVTLNGTPGVPAETHDWMMFRVYSRFMERSRSKHSVTI